MQHDRGQHPREADVDREMSGTENLRHGIDPQPPFAPDQLVVGGILWLDAIRNRKLLGPRRQLSEGGLPAVAITQYAVLDLDLSGRYVPCLGRRGHESRPRLSRGQPIPHPVPLHRIGRARDLQGSAGVGISVNVAVRSRSVRRVDDPDRIEIGVELFRDDRRQAGVDSLAHLDLARVRDDRPVLADANVRMNRVSHLIWRKPLYVDVRRSHQRPRITARGKRAGSLVDSGPDPRIGAAAAQIAAHPRVDLHVVGRRV